MVVVVYFSTDLWFLAMSCRGGGRKGERGTAAVEMCNSGKRVAEVPLVAVVMADRLSNWICHHS